MFNTKIKLKLYFLIAAVQITHYLLFNNAVDLIKGKKTQQELNLQKTPQSGSDICLYSLPM